MNSLAVRIITPERILFEGEASMVTAPGMEGEFGVLPGHSPLVSTLRPGAITVERAGAPALKIAVTEGVVEVTPNHYTILTEAAASLEGMTQTEAQAKLKDAQSAVAEAVTEEEKRAAEKRLRMAEAAASAF